MHSDPDAAPHPLDVPAFALALAQTVPAGDWSPAHVANARQRARLFTEALLAQSWFRTQRTMLQHEIAFALIPRYSGLGRDDILTIAVRVMDPTGNHALVELRELPGQPGRYQKTEIPACRMDDPLAGRVVQSIIDLLPLLAPPPPTPVERLWTAVALLTSANTPAALANALPEVGDGVHRDTCLIVPEPGVTEAEHRFMRRLLHGAEAHLAKGERWDGRERAGRRPKHPELETRDGCAALVTATIAALLAEGGSASVPNVAARLDLKSKRSLQMRLRRHGLDWPTLQRQGAAMAGAQP